MSPTVRVATYNIHKGRLGIGPLERSSIHDIQRALHSTAADFVFLQEVQSEHTSSAKKWARHNKIAQHEYLASSLDYHVAYEVNARTRAGAYGNALLSRWPIVSIQHRDMSDHRFEQRGLLHAKVALPNTEVDCIVVHLGLLAGSRQRQLQHLMAYITEHIISSSPLIIAGDFNDWQGRLGSSLSRLGLSEAGLDPETASAGGKPFYKSKRLATFPAKMPILPLDRIYTRGFQVLDLRVLRGKPWSRASDHAPMVADLKLL